MQKKNDKGNDDVDVEMEAAQEEDKGDDNNAVDQAVFQDTYTADVSMIEDPTENPTAEDVNISAKTNGFGLLPKLQQESQQPVDDHRQKEVDRHQHKETVSTETQHQKQSKGKTTNKFKPNQKQQSTGGPLTVSDLSKDPLFQLAHKTWSSHLLAGNSLPFDAALVEKIYKDELGNGEKVPSARALTMLEISRYLENYLWPFFNAESASLAHIMSIVLMVNEKFKENVAAWLTFEAPKDLFSSFFSSFLALRTQHTLTSSQQHAYLSFLTYAFQSLENEMVRKETLKLVGLPLWHALSAGRLQLELHEHPQLVKPWKNLAKKDAKAAAANSTTHIPIKQRPETTYLPLLITEYFQQLAKAAPNPDGPVDTHALLYCEKFVQLLNDLLSQLPTRRFLHAVLDDKAVLVTSRVSPLYNHPACDLYRRLVAMLHDSLTFPIDDHTGDAMLDDAVVAQHYERVQQLQRLLFRHVPKLRQAAYLPCGTLSKKEDLMKHLKQLTQEELKFLVVNQLRLIDENDPSMIIDPGFLMEVMVSAYEKPRPQRQIVQSLPLYPTESVLLDDKQVPSDSFTYSGESILALPKINLQFLTLTDYLLRNFHLFRLEAAYEIQQDIVDVIRRTSPRLGENNQVQFEGWARMANPMENFSVAEVKKPKVGDTVPAAVYAQITIQTRFMREDVQKEWDELKQHDVMFLVSLQPHGYDPPRFLGGKHVLHDLKAGGLAYVRGCEVLEIKDEGILLFLLSSFFLNASSMLSVMIWNRLIDRSFYSPIINSNE